MRRTINRNVYNARKMYALHCVATVGNTCARVFINVLLSVCICIIIIIYIYIYIYINIYIYISIYYYMSCSISRPVSCPDVPVSARVRIYLSHIYNKKLSHTCNWAHIKIR